MTPIKKIIASILLTTVFAGSTFAATFTDVNGANQNFVAIEYLSWSGTLEGYPNGSFQPDKTINRAELMKILIEGHGVVMDEEDYQNCFPDVTDQWFAKYVCFAAERLWVEGYPDGNFKPERTVNKVEAVKMLVNALDLRVLLPEFADNPPFKDTYPEQWYAPYIQLAYELNLLDETGEYFSPTEGMSRGLMSEYIYRTLVASDNGLSSFQPDQEYAFLETAELSALLEELVNPEDFAQIIELESLRPESPSITVSDLNDKGQVVGMSMVSGLSNGHSYLWEAGKIKDLGSLGGANAPSQAFEINEAGQIVGSTALSSSSFGSNYVYIYEDGVMKNTFITGDGFGINSLGHIVGDRIVNDATSNGYLLKDGKVSSLPMRAFDINDSGQIVGTVASKEGNDTHAALWQNGELTVINTDNSYAKRINNKGIVAGFADGYAFIWEDGVMTKLTRDLMVEDLNDKGQVVGGGYTAFLWQNGVHYDLNDLLPLDSDWKLFTAKAINENGQIAGEGKREGSSGTRAFLLTLPDYVQID